VVKENQDNYSVFCNNSQAPIARQVHGPQAIGSLAGEPRPGPASELTPLGTTTGLVVGLENQPRSKTRNPQLKQDMLRAVKDLLPTYNRLQACQAHPVKDGLPGHKYAANVDRVALLDICRCDNPWICPHCGPIVAELKSQLVREDLQVWTWEGYTACSVTLTLQHFKSESLTEVDRRYCEAYKQMWDGKPGRRFKEKWHIVGRELNPDVTYTVANGWHRHGNNILYLERRLLSELETMDFEQELTDLWCSNVEMAGGFADRDHGVKVRFGDIFDVADYIASKAMGCGGSGKTDGAANRSDDKWGLPEEITKSYLKDRAKGANPTRLLLAYLWGEDRFGREEAGRLFREYAGVFSPGGTGGSGKKFLGTSPGFRAKLDELKEKYKDKLRVLQDGVIKPAWSPRLTWFSREAWGELVKQEAVYWFNDEARIAGLDVVRLKEFLDDCGITEIWYPTLQPEPPNWWLKWKLKIGDGQEVDIKAILELNQFMRDWNGATSDSSITHRARSL